jgi:hypothetical protein
METSGASKVIEPGKIYSFEVRNIEGKAKPCAYLKTLDLWATKW